MKKSLLLLFGTILVTLPAVAATELQEGVKYRFQCLSYGSGSIALGANHSSAALLYYDTSTTISDDGWWYITANGDGYSIQNASSGEYLQYDPERIESQKKGLSLTNNVSNDSARWTISFNTFGFNIINVAETTQWFNVRLDGTYLVGTYASHTSVQYNEYFQIYDEDGNIVEGYESTNSGSDTESSGVVSDYISNLLFNSEALAYDSNADNYYTPVPSSVKSTATYTFSPTFTLSDSNYKVVIDGQEVTSGGSIMLTGLDCTQTYAIEVQNASGTTLASSGLIFTYLPVIDITLASCNSSTYTEGRMRVIDPNNTELDSLDYAKFRWRGSTALSYEKKAYAVKMLDAAGNSLDRSFFGLRSDNNWILDAMAIDYACMRNRVSTDLWNDFATKPYNYVKEDGEPLTGTRGQFVEVLLNGQYHGLYCMTEKMDRKQVKAKKINGTTVRGSVYKSSQWSYEVLMGHDSDRRDFPKRSPRTYNNNSGAEDWASYEVKYPDYEDEPIDWEPLWNAINFVATSSDDEFIAGYSTYFDSAVIDDYYLFIELMLATDNHGKNMYFFNYDQTGNLNPEMISIAVWDLDGTWGRRWNGSAVEAGQDFDEYIWANEHGQHTIFHRLKELDEETGWITTLANRYAELRPTVFNPDSLKARFQNYAELFALSGADVREEARWGRSVLDDIQDDVVYIGEWIDTRVAYLDVMYNYTEVEEDTTMPVTFRKALGSLTLDGKGAGYDETGNYYLAPLPSDARGATEYALTVDYTIPYSSDYYLTIEGEQVSSGSSVTFKPLSCDNSYTMGICDANGNTLYTASLQFTFLPIVDITLDDCNASDYTLASFYVYDPNNDYADTLAYATMKYRGKASDLVDKRSYALKLCDADRGSIDCPLFGLRDDNSWVLDALTGDPSGLRNRVATDLWLDFSSSPYHYADEPEALMGARGEFVEVFLNGSYHGLYCMLEKLDRKQVKAKKISGSTVRGSVYKGDGYTYETLFGHDKKTTEIGTGTITAIDNTLTDWAGFEMEYPDLDDDGAIDWTPLYKAVEFVSTSSDEEFAASYATYFDSALVSDYYLLLDVLLATDNHADNIYWVVYRQDKDNMLTLAPWGLDATFGIDTDLSKENTRSEQVLNDYLASYEGGQNSIYLRLAADSAWQNSIAAYYAELRQDELATDNLLTRFDTYAELLEESCADSREETAWSAVHEDMQAEITYAKEWLSTRLSYLDTYYDDVLTSISSATISHSETDGMVDVYTLSGVRVLTGVTISEARKCLPQGIYIAGSKKLYIK